MRFGVWYHVRNPERWHQPADLLYAQTLDQISRAEALGFDSAWVSEHHFTEDGYLPSTLLFLAAVAARTRQMRLGTLVLLLPLHDPLRVAEDAAVLDLISGGRLDLGIAAGYRTEEFEVFGVPHRERGRRMDQAIPILQGAWADGPFSFQGPDFQHDGVNVTPKPLQRPGPPLWMGGQSRAAIRRAARFGCHLLPSSTTEFDIRATYDDALREFGRDPAQYRIKTFRPLFCADDPERAWDELKEHYLYQHNLYRKWYREAGDSSAPDLTSADQLPRQNYIVGTPDECAAAIRALHAEMPFEEFIFWTHPPGFPVERAMPSLELFRQKVVPQLGDL